MFNFGVVDSLDTVPAEFKAVYGTQPNAEGKFEVKAEFKSMVAAYQGVNTALVTERGKVTSLNKENADRRGALNAYTDLLQELGVTPEDPNDIPGAIKAHVASLTTKVAGGEAFKGNLKKIQEEAEKRVKAITDSHAAELAAMRTTLEEHLVDKEVLAALAENKAKAGGRVLLPHVKRVLKVVKDAAGKYGVVAVDDTGQARYNNAAQPMTVKDVVNEFKTAPEYAFAFESEGGSGTGHQPGTGKQPPPKTGAGAGELSSTQKISAGLTQMQNRH